MRRFELSEGSSHKFWEITVHGDTIQTRWGRIGAAGQSKSKECASAAAAQKDADRQIARKTGKGYAEVSGTASPARPDPTPAATPPAESIPKPPPVAEGPAAPALAVRPAAVPSVEPPAPDPTSDGAPADTAAPGPTIAELVPGWTDLHPRHGGAFSVHTTVDLARLRARVDDTAGEPVSELLDGDWDPERMRAVYQELLDFDRVEAAEALARIAAVLRGQSPVEARPRGPYITSAATAWIQLLLALHGPARTLEVWCPDRRWTARFQKWSDIEGVRDLRRAIAAADAEEYARVVRIVTDWRTRTLPGPTGSTAPLESASAYLLPGEGWWKEAGQRDSLHLTCVDDPAHLQAFAREHDLPNWANLLAIVRSLAAEHGAGAAETVAHCGLKLPPNVGAPPSVELALVHGTVEVLAALPGLAPIRALLARRGLRRVHAQLPKVLAIRPADCIQVGLEISTPEPALRRMLLGWVREHPAAAEAVAPQLSAEGRARLDRILDAIANPGPEAALSTLPELFTRPPWERTAGPGPKALKVTAELPPPRVILDAEQQAAGERVQAEAKALRSRPIEVQHNWHADAVQTLALALTRPDDARAQAATNYWEDDYDELFLGAAVALPVSLASELAVAALAGKATSAHISAYATPAVAQWMLDGLVKKTVRDRAYAWMHARPEYATRAWLPTVVGRRSKKQAAARAALMALMQAQPERVKAAVAAYPEAVQAAFAAHVVVDPLLKLPSKLPATDFVDFDTLPPVRLLESGARLPPSAIQVVVTCLSLSGGPSTYAGLAQLQERVTPDSLAELATAVFDQWLLAEAPAKSDWALTVLARVGNDETAGQLAPKVRKWPGESQHKRAVKGLDVLLGIGTEVALMHLNGIAEKVKFKGIKQAARDRIHALAQQRGLRPEELADRLVPRLGLDEAGALHLDYGPRHFTVHFDEALRPVVRDHTGKLRKSLPKPGARDEAAVAEPAQARFKQLKKDVRALAAIQLRRFEAAMVSGRRWSADDFRTYLVDHPLVCHLVRRLVWGVYEDDHLRVSFRVADDNTYADAEDEELELPAGRIGIVHPIDLDEATRAAWGDVLADYELLQPFVQLGRPTYRLDPAEASRRQLVRNPTQAIVATRILGLTSRGWERAVAEDAGVVWQLLWRLPDGERVIHLNLGGGGLWMGMVHEQDEHPTIESLSVHRVGTGDGDTHALPLSSIPTALMSELLATLHQLQGTA